MRSIVLASLDEAADIWAHLRTPALLDSVEAAAELLADAFRAGGRVLTCGNGGSMTDAMHFAEELTGRFRADRPALGALAISDPGHLTCVANDLGYEQVFRRYVEAVGRAGDVLVPISTSGTSPNVVLAAEAAKQAGITVIALTGRRDSPLGQLATVDLCVPGGRWADRVQEAHGFLLHVLVDLVERALFPPAEG